MWQVAVKYPVSMTVDVCRTTQVLSELVLQSSALIFFLHIGESGKKKTKKGRRKRNHSGSWQ
jgi:hypothetical protein